MTSQPQKLSGELRSNFSHLGQLDAQLVRLGVLAEKYFAEDPNTSMVKIRQFGECLAQILASRMGVYASVSESQFDLLRRLRDQGLPREIFQLFDEIRRTGNDANHSGRDDHGAALSLLKYAAQLGIWFQRTVGKSDFKSGPFVPPAPPKDESAELCQELERLSAIAQAEREAREDAAQRLRSLETRLRETDDERGVWEQLAQEAETDKAALEVRLTLLQTQAQTRTKTEIDSLVESGRTASRLVVLDEAATRKLIDSQLSQAGWTVDSETLTHAKGARPKKGQNLAISEWPTRGKQSADYVLFAGLMPVAVVEAKRANIDVAGKITQAERYARGFAIEDGLAPAWIEAGRTEAWSDGEGGTFRIPYVYSCNGRSYHKQLAEKSGTWFRDLRANHNQSRPHETFHSPNGLLDLLRRDVDKAKALLNAETFDYLGLRKYQEKAIGAVESALAQGERECLLAMATGTGKTRTIIGLMYRLLKAERFRRILFLVDRTALGTQAQDAFADAPLEGNLPISKVYNIALLGDMAPEAETRIQVATVQAMVKRLLHSDDPPGIDSFDCIIVDEAHRGYTLDQEMTDGEIEMRDASQYLSTYRRVLDHFDAVKVGLTATPAKHTTEIFGKPVYTYSYREAVADDWLVDHEPPIRYTTLLSKNGIDFGKGETVAVVRSGTGTVETAELDDDLHFEVESFNRSVITENFNKVICQELASELDPLGEEKTLIFCATDLHADMVVRLLNEAFAERFGEGYNVAAVQKITGTTDRVDECIRRFKNEKFPNVAVTVDLLTTGIDVPEICHLVFMRRVRSRILYEQMKGRATRLCGRIGKTVFRIHDPVDLYASLENVDTMKPLVQNPSIPFSQLVDELADPASRTAPGGIPGRSHADEVLATMSQRLMRILRRAGHKAHDRADVRQKLDELEQLWGVAPTQLHTHLSKLGPDGALDFLKTHRGLERQLVDLVDLIGFDRSPVISTHADALLSKEQMAEGWSSPDDYLESFEQFVRRSINESVALSVVVNRPRDLTRSQLQELRLFLGEKNYTEANLKVAWKKKTNVEIAAGIVGFVRRAALGEDLMPFQQRVGRAVEKIVAMRPWSSSQATLLRRIAKQLTHETVIDRGLVNEAFPQEGGAKQIDLRLDRHLDEVLERLSEWLWVA